MLLILYLVKVAGALAYGYILSANPYYRSIADTWMFYEESVLETDVLISRPDDFFSGLVKSLTNSPGDSLFAGSASQWNNAKSELFIKILAAVNVVTAKSYYTNALFFAFASFLGSSALFRLLKPFATPPVWLLLGCCYLLPSTLFWCSGNHKDTLISAFIFLIFYCSFRLIKFSARSLRHWLLVVFAAPVLFVLRNYTLLLMIPVILTWVIHYRFGVRSTKILTAGALCTVLVICVIPLLPERFNPLQVIVHKQQEFLTLEGKSVLPTTPLQADLSSFAFSLPRAVSYGFFKPFITDIKGLFYLPSFFEVTAVICSIILFAWRRSFPLLLKEPVLWSILIFSMLLMLITGYIVHFVSPLTRYRSIPLPLFLGVMSCVIFFRPNIKN